MIWRIVLFLLFLVTFILAIVYNFKVYNDSKSGNPLESEEPNDKQNYFNEDSFKDYLIKGNCNCGNDIINDFCTEELLISENKPIKNFIQSEDKFL